MQWAMQQMITNGRTEFISVSELASLMDVSFAEVISKCMSLGIMVSINQRLDAEVIELVSSEFGFDVEFIDMEKQMEMEEEALYKNCVYAAVNWIAFL